MRGLVAFKHFWSLFWSLLVTQIQALYERVVAFNHFWSLFGSLLITTIQALYERVGCFQSLLVTFWVTFDHNNTGSV
jgi:hypothetical protein